MDEKRSAGNLKFTWGSESRWWIKMWKLKNGNGLLLMFTWRLGKWVCWTICQLTSRSSLSALQHECFFARGKLGGLEQREPARGLLWVWNWLLVPDPPRKPLPDSSQIFPWAGKCASCSRVNNEDLQRGELLSYHILSDIGISWRVLLQ